VSNNPDLRYDSSAAPDNLGLAFERSGEQGEAAALYEHAIKAGATDVEIRLQLGTALLSQQRCADALVAFEAALRLSNQNLDAHNGLGIALHQLGRSREAEAMFRAALALDPECADAVCNIGKVLLDDGDIEAAIGWFENALKLEPRNGHFHWFLVFSRSGVVDDRALADMECLAREMDSLPETQQVELNFALAAAYENRSRFDDAFEHMRAGNTLKRRAVVYDEGGTLNLLSALEGVITFMATCAELRDCGNASSRPIFVFGMPRSGTTLIEQILSAHPAVTAGGELRVFEAALRAKQPYLWPEARGTSVAVPVAELRGHIRAMGDRYVRDTDVTAGSAKHLTDKQTINFGFAPLIHLALPNARLINVKRDRLDTCMSCFATLFTGQAIPYAYDLAELARYYRAYEHMMAEWRALLPSDRFIEIEYERLVDDFESQARRLFAFCDLPWDARALSFHEVQRPVHTASRVQVRQPLYRTALGRGKRFAAHLVPLIETLGT
jgi:tetratricopeptide (TPR) repeat protein